MFEKERGEGEEIGAVTVLREKSGCKVSKGQVVLVDISFLSCVTKMCAK